MHRYRIYVCLFFKKNCSEYSPNLSNLVSRQENAPKIGRAVTGTQSRHSVCRRRRYPAHVTIIAMQRDCLSRFEAFFLFIHTHPLHFSPRLLIMSFHVCPVCQGCYRYVYYVNNVCQGCYVYYVNNVCQGCYVFSCLPCQSGLICLLC